MIYDIIDNCRRYRGMSPAMDTALDFLEKGGFEGLTPGRYDLENGVYYMVQSCGVKPLEETRWESHHSYSDIQLALDEGELIGYAPTTALTAWGEYDGTKDVCFSDDKSEGLALPMTPGAFAVFASTDAHRPCRASGARKTIRKIVIKIPE